ncbi:uncharacterized G-patch domain protein DDB_G0278987 isoform X1 [Cephus cinctus]|uniref:Uncharacterized G-patch domain protein DDB_G0278987 isoform X1 n=1 Tax=Cephus cinctus TaxID=211228 RepID=A0AAJ7BT80_CEPCN|nr:uncharacterized G-patch domain protein DDB_G0278987 isoform X2 [Cephus cinctus]XP_015592980.1 uncharacterized G-patch domain protein DDB_G0278987 isoform X1 [Cephus cinctus]
MYSSSVFFLLAILISVSVHAFPIEEVDNVDPEIGISVIQSNKRDLEPFANDEYTDLLLNTPDDVPEEILKSKVRKNGLPEVSNEDSKEFPPVLVAASEHHSNSPSSESSESSESNEGLTRLRRSDSKHDHNDCSCSSSSSSSSSSESSEKVEKKKCKDDDDNDKNDDDDENSDTQKESIKHKNKKDVDEDSSSSSSSSNSSSS